MNVQEVRSVPKKDFTLRKGEKIVKSALWRRGVQSKRSDTSRGPLNGDEIECHRWECFLT